MTLYDINASITTEFNELNDLSAGDEPWQRNINSFNIEEKDTDKLEYITAWAKWHGMYREIAELRSTIDIPCKWIIGKEIIADEETRKIINKIKGNGKDTFRKILTNIKRTSKICGDGFAEIIRDKAGRLINLKILDPATIKIIANRKGIIKRYEQVWYDGLFPASSNKTDKIETLNSWTPEKIFHISNERIADEIHGIPEPEKLQKIIKWRHQGMSDNATILHRYGKPTNIYEADTSDETELENIKNVLDKAISRFENVVVPKGTLSKIERISVPQYSTLDPIPWLTFVRSYFTESSNVPDLVRGKSDEVSLAAGKLNILGFKEKIIMEQLEFAEEIKSQLGLEISFTEPPNIDIEIAKTEEEMGLKKKAKMQKGGEQIVR